MCNYGAYINWENFLAILSGLQGKSLESKLSIFFKISDREQVGSLSKEQIKELADISLSKFVHKSTPDDPIVENLVDYFTKLLFESLHVDLDQRMPLETLKNAIIQVSKQEEPFTFPSISLLFLCRDTQKAISSASSAASHNHNEQFIHRTPKCPILNPSS